MFSGYRFLWMQVLFDLPVTTRKQRKAATQFRQHLLDLGFDMAQFSVYQKWLVGKEAAMRMVNKVRLKLPSDGRVHILVFTDKQYENIITFHGKIDGPKNKNPTQFELF